jgi:heme O synthase-like polyprenyltransferase
MKPKQRPQSSTREIVIILLLFTFCFLVVILGVESLYDVVRNCIIAILVLYLGWKGMSRGNMHSQEPDNTLEDNDDK